MYLTQVEYTAYGGTITSATTYDRLEYKARAVIDGVTFGRLQTETVIRESVKRCMFELINLEEAAEQCAREVATGIASANNDGVSVSYRAADEATASLERTLSATCKTYLANERDSKGVPLLYSGIIKTRR